MKNCLHIIFLLILGLLQSSLGNTPTEMYQDDGTLFWERELNANGKIIKETQQGSCPFLFQGQYYDAEIELAYNRFRYYDPEDGRYISQDPIGLASGEPNFYAYVEDTNTWVDPFGLTVESRSTNVIISKGWDANATMPNYVPPYKPNAKVTEFTTTREEIFVRVHVIGNFVSSQIGKVKSTV